MNFPSVRLLFQRVSATCARCHLHSSTACGPAGACGASLIARPLKREFYTLSAWEDRDALYAYAQTEPHRGIMTSLRPTMRTSTFTFWEVNAVQFPITWAEAERRLTEQARNEAAGSGAVDYKPPPRISGIVLRLSTATQPLAAPTSPPHSAFSVPRSGRDLPPTRPPRSSLTNILRW
ncbi:hypothetical protein [Streptomyces sp. GESEQ-4]|uniref:hypothetical protein n=1 Tax=Streptomyces sp. GESEQ-4 TaxID=2812655 RepID=UPI0035A8CE8F